MPHIHKFYDFVTSAFIVHRDTVLLVNHRKYDEWLPIGGHIELDEDPEEALFREIREECGLDVKILATKPSIAHPGVKPILTPSFIDCHRITPTHKHVAFVYFATSRSKQALLDEREHKELRWFTRRDLDDSRYKLTKSIRFYCLEALKAASEKKKSA